MTTYRPVDSKREEFRKYLERAGVMETFTRVLVSLYEEPDKGIDALEFVKKQLIGDHAKESSSFEEELKSQIEALQAENEILRTRLSQYEEVKSNVVLPTPSKTQSSQKSDVHSEQSKTSGIDQPDQEPSITSSQKAT